MFIHNEDNTEVQVKITDAGNMFIYCPGCNRVWESSLKAIKQPLNERPFRYGGTGIDLALGSSESDKKVEKPPVEAARELFPEAFR